MNTLFDYVSSVNGIMYLIALGSIAGFAIMWEVFNPKPFSRLASNIAEDLRLIASMPSAEVFAMGKKLVLAPMYFMMYLASMPFLFAMGILAPIGSRVAGMGGFEWNPVRAYFRGKKKAKKDADKQN